MSTTLAELGKNIYDLTAALPAGLPPWVQVMGRNGIFIQKELQNSPLLSCLENCRPTTLEVSPAVISQGDMLLFQQDKWQLGIYTGEKVLGRPLLYLGKPTEPRSILPSIDYFRVGGGTNIEIPPIHDIPPGLPTDDHFPPYFSASSSHAIAVDKMGGGYEVLINHPPNMDIRSISNKPYRLVPITSLDQIVFEHDEWPIMQNDYLYISGSGRPLVISDFHQKLAYHIAQLIDLGFLLNQSPVIDWLDEHDDGLGIVHPLIDKVDRKPYSLAELGELVCQANCGQAAGLLHAASQAKIRFFSSMSWIRPPSWGTVINPFVYRLPFARTGSHPHLLSYETDHPGGFYDYLYSDNSVSFDRFVQYYFTWLQNGGVAPSNYDAACIYSGAPIYCHKRIAVKMIEKMVRIFD